MPRRLDRADQKKRPLQIQIPPLPTTFAEVVQLYRQDTATPSTEKLKEIVERDAAMASYVLKQVNSAYLGVRRPISEIERAVTLLGFMPVCNIVLSVGLKQAFDRLKKAEIRGVYTYIMKTSAATAAFGRDLCEHLQLPFVDTAFAAGLLHQLGRLVLLFSAAERYVPLWYPPEHADEPTAPLAGQEQALFRTNYVTVGEEVARMWKLPDEIICAIRFHQNPRAAGSTELSTLCYVVSSAHNAAVTLYHPLTGQKSSTFFGLSAPLAELARMQGVIARDLIEVFVRQRSPVRQFADSLLEV